MRPARQYTGYFRDIRVGPFIRYQLDTNDTIKNEVFGSLEFLSEVEDVGKEYLRKFKQPGNLSTRFLQFQAFIRQAKLFYDAPAGLPRRASPLNYYYSFLNLGKAFIALSNNTFVSGQVHHGLTYRQNSVPLSCQTVNTRNGVFPKFFQLLTGHSVSRNTPFNIVNLLGYCSDVGLEYELGNFGISKLVPCNYCLGVHTPNNTCHPILACFDYGRIINFSKSLKTFNSYFEEVQLDSIKIKELFDVLAEHKGDYRFFESINDYPLNQNGILPVGQIVVDSYNALKYFFEPNPYPDKIDFRLAAPLRVNLQIPMREILAIYLIMFFLSSLIRYHPHYLERLYASKDAWIIERFTKSAPVTFLRHIRNLIYGRVFAYGAR